MVGKNYCYQYCNDKSKPFNEYGLPIVSNGKLKILLGIIHILDFIVYHNGLWIGSILYPHMVIHAWLWIFTHNHGYPIGLCVCLLNYFRMLS